MYVSIGRVALVLKRIAQEFLLLPITNTHTHTANVLNELLYEMYFYTK